MHIYYDGNRPVMVLYNGATYRYVHSLQGDILGLQNGTGAFVVEYRYDAWGRQISKTGSLAATLGTLNPFRYRGYVYDEETSLYYLRSRYYNPEWGRFISADFILGKHGALLQHNLFTYSKNDPINNEDEDGTFALSVWATGALIGAAFGVVTQVTANWMYGKKWYVGIIGAAFGGAVYGVLSLSCPHLWVAALASAGTENVVNEALEYTTGKKQLTKDNIDDSLKKVTVGTFVGATGYYMTGRLAGEGIPVYNITSIALKTTPILTVGMMKQTAVQAAYNLSALPYSTAINNEVCNAISK